MGLINPVCFTEYRGFHISGVSSVHKHVNAFQTKQSVPVQYCRWPLFRGVCKVGLDCTHGQLHHGFTVSLFTYSASAASPPGLTDTGA